jgi:DNA polymerase I-like protein with 3'-5' exonuclease and polymerase domains
MIDKRLTEEGIDFKHLLFYHDDHTVEVREDQAERAREIIMECFEEAPKEYGVNIMTCGDCKIGDNYFSVH